MFIEPFKRNTEGRKPRKRLDEQNAGMYELATAFRASGMSYRDIAIQLSAMGYRTSKGGDIKHTQVVRVLRSR